MKRFVLLKKTFWTLIIIATIYLSYNGIPYFIATYQYDNLISQNPLSKEKVEEILCCYSVQKIKINESLWAKGEKLKPGESIWQYSILWIEPIDVIYNEKLQVVEIIPSFE